MHDQHMNASLDSRLGLAEEDRPEAVPADDSLDPEDWRELRQLGHRMVDDIFAQLQGIRQRTVWQPPSPEARASYHVSMPTEGVPAATVYEEYRRFIQPYPLGNTHPRYWGWVTGAGTAGGILADMLASSMNGHVAFGDQAAVHIEAQVIGWLRDLLGLPEHASGLLVTGGSVATLIGLTAARDAKLASVLTEGMAQSRATAYASLEVHNCVDKAVGVLGVGRKNLRRVPVDRDFRIDCAALRAAIAADRAAGMTPFCLVASAGTVNTGAIDDLPEMRRIADGEGLWLHVDAALGVGLAASPSLRTLIQGIESADSIAFDLHKWFHMQYDVGCVLVRDADSLRRSFSPSAAYLAPMPRGITSGGEAFGELGIDLSRGFRALRVWFGFKEHGLNRYGRLVEQNVDQAGYLALLISRTPYLELLAPVPTNIVCFRYRGRGELEESRRDHVNREIVMALHESGLAVPSYTTIDGRFAIRVAITNHRSRREDFDLLISEVSRLGEERSNPHHD